MASSRPAKPSRASKCSRTTESQPPESPTTRRSSGATRVARKRPTRAQRSADRLFLETAIAHQPLITGGQQFGGRQLGKLLQRILQGLLEVLCHGRMVAMRSTEWFIDDLV